MRKRTVVIEYNNDKGHTIGYEFQELNKGTIITKRNSELQSTNSMTINSPLETAISTYLDKLKNERISFKTYYEFL
jgi:hypothetical protein